MRPLLSYRKILSFYRKIQYAFFHRFQFGVMPSGILCYHEPYEEEINHGDVVHPCVRYIKQGYLGHTWWMVYTPYYQSNDITENPILCYAESNESVPPCKWKIFCQVQGQPMKGYNSDPTLFYDNEKLYVMWRENLTERCKNSGSVRATFGALVEENGIGSVFGPLVSTDDYEIDAEVSPTFIKAIDGTYRCLAMHLLFHLNSVKALPLPLRSIVIKVGNILDLLGIWGEQKSFGIAQWSSPRLEEKFRLDNTIKFSNKNKLYRPWHMDFFEYNKKLYAIVQSNQCNADLCLAESEDGVHFKLFPKPLMTNKTCGKVGIYKPTGGVVEDMFYLYYTAQDLDNRALNKLYLTQLNINQLLRRIQ